MSYLNEREYLEAMQLKAQGKYTEMLQKLDKVSDSFYPVDMNKMPVDYYRGAAYFELKQYDKALEKFVNSRKRMEYYPTVMNNEASALYMTSNYKEAEIKYLEVKRLFPNYIEPQINLLSLYANQKRYTETKTLIAELDNIHINIKYVKNYSVFLEIKNYFKETIH
jgi:tetratricopeptide (TPR) repeat protein